MSESKQPIKNLVENHKFIFVASVAGILGFLLTLSIFVPPAKRPFYSVKSFNLINNSSSTIENLDIKYKICDENPQESECQLKEIKSLTVTKIMLWNGGRIKIDKTDIDDNPITIRASYNNSILDAKVIHSSNDKTDFRLEPKSNTINFDFLDSGNGGVIQVIHTGLSDKDIFLDGYVEDSKFEGDIRREYLISNKERFIPVVLYLILVIGMALTIVYALDIKSSKNKIKSQISELKKSLSENNLSDEAKLNKSKELERYKNHLIITNSFSYFMSSLVVILIFLTIIAFIQFSLNRLTLRYPLSSYEVFNSEVN